MKFFPLVMLISEYITPVMYVDPSVNFLVVTITYILVTIALSLTAAAAVYSEITDTSMLQIFHIMEKQELD